MDVRLFAAALATATNLFASLLGLCHGLNGKQSKPQGHYLVNPLLLEKMMGYAVGYTGPSEFIHSATP